MDELTTINEQKINEQKFTIEILARYLSHKDAERIAKVITKDTLIVIDGTQAPTGKTTLCNELKALGFNAVEQYFFKEEKRNDNYFKIVISLNKFLF